MEVWKEQSLKIAQNNIWKTVFSWYIKASTVPRIHDDTCRIPQKNPKKLRIFSGDSSRFSNYGRKVWPHSELSKPADLWSLRHVSRNSRSSSTGPGPSKQKKRNENILQGNLFFQGFQIFWEIDSRDSFPLLLREMHNFCGGNPSNLPYVCIVWYPP